MTRATFIEDWDEFERREVPGSISVAIKPGDRGQLWYCCPCGCGTISVLRVGNGHKPDKSPSWHWNGSTDRPTLTPSVHHVGHWHGWLTDGEWRSC